VEGIKKKSIFVRIAERLDKTRKKISGRIEVIASGHKINEKILNELEEILITADLGVTTSLALMSKIREKVRRQELNDIQALKKVLRQEIAIIINKVNFVHQYNNTKPCIIMVIGSNGVGKTTSIAKLAYYYKSQGCKVLLGAADTFRAAASEQLAIWAYRVGCDLIHPQGCNDDPSAIAFDTVVAAIKRDIDLAVIDTAGRLHTKDYLMDEIKKIYRVIGKCLPGAPHEVFLVLDATTGQNAINQALFFNKAVPLTGILLTKLDGTAKGGVVVAIIDKIKIPIIFVGIGEGLDDLKPFNSQEFIDAII